MKMKHKLLGLLMVCFTVFVVIACHKEQSRNDKLTQGLPSSGGKTLEMLVVAEDNLYKGELRDSIGENFEKAQKGLPQKEPLFDVVHLQPAGFIHSDMMQKHRNILIIDLKAGNPNKMYQEISKRVYPQAVYKLMVDNRDSMFAILTRFYPTIKKQFKDNEHKRMFNAYKRTENVNLDEKILKNFGLKLTIGEDYYLATEKKDFFWIRKETEKESFNIMIYKQNMTSQDLLLQKKIIDIRDRLAKENIPGSVRGSYMGTDTRLELFTDTVKVNDIVMIETRGIWRLFGDFMGGPFINYVFQNPKTKQYNMIDCFLYRPNKDKRDYLMQLESIVYTINRDVK